MLKKMLAGAATAAIVLMFAGQSGADLAPPSSMKVLTNPASGTAVTLRVGEKLQVRLSSNPTTGYDWQVVSTSRSLGYPTKAFRPSAPMRMGSGGITYLTW